MDDGKVLKCLKRALKMQGVKRLLDSLEEPVEVKDMKGEVLAGVGEVKKGEEYPISYLEEQVGIIYGSKKANAVVSMLEYIIESEMEKSELADETLGTYREINLLFNMSEKISTILNTKQASEVIMEELKKRADFDYGAIFLKEADTDELGMVFDIGEDKSINEDFFANNLKLVQDIITAKDPEVITDLGVDSRNGSKNTKLKSIIIAPLMARGKAIGAIYIGNTGSKEYKSFELKILNSLALQAAVALENSRLYASMERTFFETVNTLSQTIDIRDPYTGGHTARVVKYCEALGAALKLSMFELTRLRFAAMLHDLGNIGVPDSILLKKDILTTEEYEQIKEHTKYGETVIGQIKWLKNIATTVRAHHERYDGKGYPDGLKGTKIPLIARIIAVADSFDAMTTDRAYRKARTTEAAMEELKKNSGTQFDPSIVDAFIGVYNEKNLEEVRNIKDSGIRL